MNLKNNKLIRRIVFLIFAVWLLSAFWNSFQRIKAVAGNVIQTRGMSDEQKRERIYGSFYQFVSACNRQIPENSTVFLVTNDPFYYYFGSYYLYPRKVLINSPDKAIDGLTSNPPAKLTKEFFKQYNISYIIVPEYKNGESRIVKVE